MNSMQQYENILKYSNVGGWVLIALALLFLFIALLFLRNMDRLGNVFTFFALVFAIMGFSLDDLSEFYVNDMFSLQFKYIMEHETGMSLVSNSNYYNYDALVKKNGPDDLHVATLNFVTQDNNELKQIIVNYQNGYIFYYTPDDEFTVYKKNTIELYDVSFDDMLAQDKIE